MSKCFALLTLLSIALLTGCQSGGAQTQAQVPEFTPVPTASPTISPPAPEQTFPVKVPITTASTSTPDPANLYVSNDAVAFYFLDTSQGWVAVDTTRYITPTNGEIWEPQSYSAVLFATTDGGQSWIERYKTKGNITSLDFRSTEDGWAIIGGSLFSTHDGGVSWTLKQTKAKEDLYNVDFVDASNGWISWFSMKDAAGPSTNLSHTTDEGSTWQELADPCIDRCCYTGQFTFTGPTTGWGLCSGQASVGHQMKSIVRTEDGGQSWQLVAKPSDFGDGMGSILFAGYAGSSFFLNAGDGWFTSHYGSTNGSLYHSIDGGRNWEGVATTLPDGTIRQPQFMSRQTGYIIFTKYEYPQPFRPKTLLTTTDGGANWRQIYPASVSPKK